jgi:hypothetical protein
MSKTLENIFGVHAYVHKEHMDASKRVGVSAEDAMEWILHFADRQNERYDLEQLSLAELDKVKFEIAAFVGMGYQLSSYGRGFIAPNEGLVKLLPGQNLAEPNPPSKKQAQQLQARVRQAMDAVLNLGRGIAFPLPQIEVWVGRGHKPARGMLGLSGKVLETFTLKLCQLLAHFALRLRYCKATDCSRLFLAKHGKRVYCSTKCQNRAGVQKFRKERKLKKKKPSAQKKKGASHGTKRR